MAPQSGRSLIGCIDLIDSFLEQGAEDVLAGLQEQLTKGILHLEQAGGQLSQQRV